ncbi:MAG: fatty acid desaturase family protein, partial [Flavobacterium sp.]
MTEKPTYNRNIEDEQFFKQLRAAAKEKVGKNAKNYPNLIKAFLLPSLYVFFWVMAMHYKASPSLYYTCFTMMGITMILIFVNLIHEACHYTLFKTRWKNEVVYSFFDIMGANSFIWANRHIRMHHNYSNTIGFDSDIEQGGMLKVFPADKGGFIQKYQHYWFIFLYPLFLLNWLLIRDFKDFYSPKSYIRKFIDIPPKEHFKLWFFKLFFFTYILIIPIVFFKIGVAQALIGFLFQVIIGGIFGLFVL